VRIDFVNCFICNWAKFDLKNVCVTCVQVEVVFLQGLSKRRTKVFFPTCFDFFKRMNMNSFGEQRTLIILDIICDEEGRLVFTSISKLDCFDWCSK